MTSDLADRALALASRLSFQKPEADVRVTVRVHPDIHDRLKQLRDQTGAGSVNDVVRNALFFYDAVVQESLAGNEVLIRSRSGDEVRFPVFIA